MYMNKNMLISIGIGGILIAVLLWWIMTQAQMSSSMPVQPTPTTTVTPSQNATPSLLPTITLEPTRAPTRMPTVTGVVESTQIITPTPY